MTIYLLEGFDSYGADETKMDVHTKYPNSSGSFQNATPDTLSGSGYYLELGYRQPLEIGITPPSSGTVVVGYHVYMPSTVNSSDLIQMHGASGFGNYHVKINPNAGGYLEIRDATGTLKATASNPLNTDTWFFIEVKLVLNTSVSVRVNGEEVVSDATGDYQRDSEVIEVVRLYNASTNTYMIDNLYVADSFLGEMVIHTVVPDTDGTHTDFDPSTGSDHYALVDEIPPVDTDYNEGSALNDKESYTGTPSPSLVGAIKGVQVNNRVVKTGQLATKIKGLVRTGGSDYTTDEEYLSAGATLVPAIWENNPNTGSPWTPAEAEAVEFGLQITGLSTTTTTTV